MQELIGYYIPMEEYYMRESVNKVCPSCYKKMDFCPDPSIIHGIVTFQ